MRNFRDGGGARPDDEPTRPATDQPPCATGVVGAGGAGGPGCGARGRRRGLAGPRDRPLRAKLAARTARGRAAAHRHTQRPGPTAPGTPAAPQATQTRGSPRGPPRVHATRSDTQHSRECKHSTQSKVQALSTVETSRTQRSRAATTSATWTALRAAPLRRLSPETTRTRPRLPSTA